MNRRTFLTTSAIGVAAGAIPSSAPAQNVAKPAPDQFTRFRLKYAPHFGMFQHSAGDDLLDQLQFMADNGFTALEDNGMRGRPIEQQNAIAQKMQALNMEMGAFVATADFDHITFAADDDAVRDHLVREMRASVETARRINAKWCTVVPGCVDPRVDMGYQTANVIEGLKRCADVCEPAGPIMVLEPVNPRDHPDLFLTKIAQAYQICKAVDSPSCCILDDLYHQQVTEGNLIPNIDRAWSEIAYFQVADNPGRCEPTTGEINYHTIFNHLAAKGYRGIVGMEHGASKPGRQGELAVIKAYQQCDARPTSN